jgi:hypothetical protein
MEGSCSTGQSPQWAVVPVDEEEEEEEVLLSGSRRMYTSLDGVSFRTMSPSKTLNIKYHRDSELFSQ